MRKSISHLSLRFRNILGFSTSATPSDQNSNIIFADECSTCDQDCSVHPQIPATMQKRIEMTNLYNTFKPYKQHILLPGGHGETWPQSVDEEDGVAKDVSTITSKSPERIMVSMYEGEDFQTQPVYLFPSGFEINGLDFEGLKKLADWIVTSKGNVDEIPDGLFTKDSIISKQALVFVCTHKKRDKRCGVAGRLLMTEFEKEIQEMGLDVGVHGVSHIGGHKYAGNVIIYRKDQRGVWVGDWYGRVKTCHVQAMLKECVVGGKVIQEHWRGQMNADPNDPNLDW